MRMRLCRHAVCLRGGCIRLLCSSMRQDAVSGAVPNIIPGAVPHMAADGLCRA